MNIGHKNCKALNEMMDTCIDLMEKEIQRVAASSATLAENNERQRQKLAELTKQINAPKSSLPVPLPLPQQRPTYNMSAPETLEKLKQVVAERKECYEQHTTELAELMQRPQYDEYTTMPYHEVEAAIAELERKTADTVRETQSLREAQLAENVALEQQLQQLEEETDALAPFLEEQRKLKLAAERTLAKLKVDIQRLKTEAVAVPEVVHENKFAKFFK